MVKPAGVVRAAQNWSKTLHLPRSTFPARADPTQRPEYLRQCTDDLYSWQANLGRPDQKSFTLHDGPPYANGDLHTGHALNKITKDIFCRFQVSQGKRVHYTPGWDCHGLPIEIKALKNADDYRRMSPSQIRSAARSLALETVDKQKAGFREWAVMGDWDNPYLTLNKDFEVRQLKVFRDMYARGLIHRQRKPVYWSPSSGTALAEAELEYDDSHNSLSAYIKFRLSRISPALGNILGSGAKIDLMIWTTTPWTLPANQVIAYHDDIQYTAFRLMSDPMWNVVSASRLQAVLAQGQLLEEDIEILPTSFNGGVLSGCEYVNPLHGLQASAQPVIHAGFVTDASGSGLVHMAPGHGFDDFEVCRGLQINAIAPVDDEGCFTMEAYPDQPHKLKGIQVLNGGSEAVLQLIQENHDPQMIWATHVHTHKYPIDWRTKKPVIIRATFQWFADVASVTDDAITALKNVHFQPPSGRQRLESFVKGRSQWCISRQRAWGVPIPALFSKGEDTWEAEMSPESVDHIINVIAERGTDAWWTDAEDDPRWLAQGLPQRTYRRGTDTMDVWFDSGTTWTQLPEAFSAKPCADVYLEGSDQHRGWFQSSLLTRIASMPKDRSNIAPFRRLITHGFLLDGNGRKMSKSLGNVVAPDQIINGTLLPPLKLKKKFQPADGKPVYDALGPDALRLWVASSDYTKDVLLGLPVLAAVNAALHKYRVTLKFLLGVLADYDQHKAADAATLPSGLKESIARHHLDNAQRAVHASYEAYEPFKAVTAINRYIASDLSSFYFEAAKDPLYAGTGLQRLSAQATCYSIFESLLVMLAPITPLLVTEVMDHASETLRDHMEKSGHHPFHRVWKPSEVQSQAAQEAVNGLPVARQAVLVDEVHTAIKKAQELARDAKVLTNGLASRVILVVPAANISEDMESVVSFLRTMSEAGQLAELFLVENVEVKQTDGKSDQFPRNPEMGRTISGNGEEMWTVKQCFELSSPDAKSWSASGVSVGLILQPAVSQKCVRCWRYVSEHQGEARVGHAKTEGAAEEHVCGRCVRAVEEQGD